jgi:hypothetical protein
MDLALILSKKYSDFQWSIDGVDYSGLVWLSDSPKPSEKELKDQWIQVKFELEYEAVSSARHFAYTASGGSDSVYMKFQRGEATKQEWLDAVKAINDANPYPKK